MPVGHPGEETPTPTPAKVGHELRGWENSRLLHKGIVKTDLKSHSCRCENSGKHTITQWLITGKVHTVSPLMIPLCARQQTFYWPLGSIGNQRDP